MMKHSANRMSPPTSVLVVRMVKGGTSLSAMRIIGHVLPQMQHKAISMSSPFGFAMHRGVMPAIEFSH